MNIEHPTSNVEWEKAANRESLNREPLSHCVETLGAALSAIVPGMLSSRSKAGLNLST